MSMTKFILILQICSALSRPCLPPLTDPEIYNSWLECGNAGLTTSLNVVNSLEPKDIEKNRIYIQFTCREVEAPDI